MSYLAHSGDTIGTLYARALGELKVGGVGPNIVTELLLLKDPSRFGIFNKRSCVALNALHMAGEFAQGDRRGEEYKRFVNVLQEVRKAFDLEDLMRVDSILTFHYEVSHL